MEMVKMSSAEQNEWWKRNYEGKKFIQIVYFNEQSVSLNNYIL